jgi:hypothetical protein
MSEIQDEQVRRTLIFDDCFKDIVPVKIFDLCSIADGKLNFQFIDEYLKHLIDLDEKD